MGLPPPLPPIPAVVAEELLGAGSWAGGDLAGDNATNQRVGWGQGAGWGAGPALPDGGQHGQVLVDLEHGGVQQRVDVLQALQPRLQVAALVALHGAQLLLRQPGETRRRHRHGREPCGGVGVGEGW